MFVSVIDFFSSKVYCGNLLFLRSKRQHVVSFVQEKINNAHKMSVQDMVLILCACRFLPHVYNIITCSH